MSGKPIINFCQAQNDTFRLLLKGYPLILNLDSWNKPTMALAKEFIDFMDSSKEKRVSNEITNSLGNRFLLEKIADAYLKLISNKSI